MEILAIISARGGSKGILNKNIVQLLGIPLISRTILVAQGTKLINRIVVTTDSQEIANIALQYRVDVPFIRPKELALDDTPGILPILHAVEWLSTNEKYNPDYIISLQPTSPLRTVGDIENAINILTAKRADSVVSVTTVEQHPYWMKIIDVDGMMRDFIKLEQPVVRRQDLNPVYIVNGSIYIAKREELLSSKSWYMGKTFPYVMPKERSIDIDSPDDLYMAELMLKKEANKHGKI